MRSRWVFAATLAVAAAALVAVFATRDVALPPPVERVAAAPTNAAADFVGAERCASCHALQFAAWNGSTHGRAGGPPSARTVLAPFAGAAIAFADAQVTPRVRAGVYEFVVAQPGEPARILRVDGVVGGGHIYGGGTQAFVTHVDGTWRVLPFEWSRQERDWFCNTNSRAGRGWAPITRATKLADCGDWPPTRVIGDAPRFANCQSCHASQATVALDSARHGYTTSATSLAINCESCHGPARRHVELAEQGRLAGAADVGLVTLATLDKDASVGVCLQCHAVKDHVRDGFVSGRPLADFYSLKFPLLGDRPLQPDGRTRTFAYQEGHLYSACYYSGGMTCTSCHDPHAQKYRSVSGDALVGRFDNRQCLSCHLAKAADVPAHTRHAAASAGSNCVACHMPSRQQPETRAERRGPRAESRVVMYARSDHTISIPRPALDSALGMTSACAMCHAGMSTADQERRIRAWWGEIKPVAPSVASQLAFTPGMPAGDAAQLLLPDSGSASASASTFAGLARYLESYVEPNVMPEAGSVGRLRRLAAAPDVDVRAVALASLHLAGGLDRGVRGTLSRALGATRGDAGQDAALRARWALALGFKGDQYAGSGALAAAVVAYQRALEVAPGDARLLVSLANAQRENGDLAGAVASYRRSIALDSRAPLAWVNLGIALGAQGDTVAAIDALTRAASLDAAEPLAWFNLGNLLFVRGEMDRAKSMYEKTVTADASITLAHFQLARIALFGRDESAALAHLRRGLAFDSSDASARQMAMDLTRRVRR